MSSNFMRKLFECKNIMFNNSTNRIYCKKIMHIISVIGVVNIVLFTIAFYMRHHANHEWVRDICYEFVHGPRNMIALIVNKFIPEKMRLHSRILYKNNEKQEPKIPSNEIKVKEVLVRLEQQASIDKKIRAEYESGTYTLDDPFVVLNPYKISPLSCLVMFDTVENSLVSVNVFGDDKIDVKHTFNKRGYVKKHVVPIYGLYPNRENIVSIEIKTKDGKVKSKKLKIQTEKLIDDLEKINLLIYNNTTSNQFNFSHNSIEYKGIKFAFDMNGNIRWYFNETSNEATYFNNGKYLYRTFGDYLVGDALYVKENYLGRIETIGYLSNGVHHDVNITGENSILILTNHLESYQDLAMEINADNGKVINQIDYYEILPKSRRIIDFKLDTRDWAHINSIVKYQGDYISSSNAQSAVIRHTKNHKIKWLLSDPQGYTTYWKQYLLRPIGENFEYPYNQHAVEVLPDYDNNPDTIDILLFDNGTTRNYMNKKLQRDIAINKCVAPKQYSRLVHYRINEVNRTVEQIWEYGKNRPELYSAFRGDANLLSNGHILGTFNRDIKSGDDWWHDTVYCEVDRDNNVKWEAYATNLGQSNNYTDYRLVRQYLYNTENDYLDIFEPVKNFVPEEVMKKYGYGKEKGAN